MQQHNGSVDWQQAAYIFALQAPDKRIDVLTMQPSSWSDKLYQDANRLIVKARDSMPADTPGPCDLADKNVTVSDGDSLETLHRGAHCTAANLKWQCRHCTAANLKWQQFCPARLSIQPVSPGPQ